MYYKKKICLFLLILSVNFIFSANYYIDSVAGIDSNNGTSISTAWKNISMLNLLTITAGSNVYLKCGSVWDGQQLKFIGSGTALNPIVINRYGTGTNPILNGNGLVGEGVVYLYNQEYIEINNLEITNYPILSVFAINTDYSINQIVYNGLNAYKVTTAGTTGLSESAPTNTSGTSLSGSVTFSFYCNLTNASYPDNLFFTGISDGTLNNNPLGADRRGVMVAIDGYGTANHVYLNNLNIHHIKGQLGNSNFAINNAITKRTGGIYFSVLGFTESITNKSRFNDIQISGCNISYSENIGLAFDNEWKVYYPGSTEYTNWFDRRFTNIHILNNVIHHIGKNAMIIRCTDQTGLIENNTCYETALGTTGNTIFTARAKGTVFQYNEGYFNRATTQTVNPGNVDGSMYDPDFGSIGIIFQYSYSHDNSEGIYWGCNTRGSANNTSGIPDPEDVGCTLRYCISQNDKGDLVFLNYSSAGNEIYNNVFYIKSGLRPNIIHENSGNNHTYNFFNNIIYNAGTGGYAFATIGQNRTIENNIFYGNHPSDEPTDINKLILNPLLVNPGNGLVGITTLDGYKLNSNSPAISSGKLISNNGGVDYYGNLVSSINIPSRGMHEFIPPCTNPINGGTISSSQTICQGQIPSPFLELIAPSGQIGTIEYQWQSSIDNINFINIINQNQSSYSINISPNTTTYYRRLARVLCKLDWLNAAISNIVTVSVNQKVTPTFTQISAICSGDALSSLPTTSLNDITGSWEPALNNTITSTYTFTPTNGLCANNATMIITVNPLPIVTASNVVGCSGIPMSLIGAPSGGTFSITNPYNGTVNTTYTYSYTDGNGCSSSSLPATITI
ncbi:MAG: hypothetical protein PSU83_07020, partial [Flavobacterium sp.]|nr:hypothetical protein [Flavobacterium sp.]